jgi:hypothetical protein
MATFGYTQMTQIFIAYICRNLWLPIIENLHPFSFMVTYLGH